MLIVEAHGIQMIGEPAHIFATNILNVRKEYYLLVKLLNMLFQQPL